MVAVMLLRPLQPQHPHQALQVLLTWAVMEVVGGVVVVVEAVAGAVAEVVAEEVEAQVAIQRLLHQLTLTPATVNNCPVPTCTSGVSVLTQLIGTWLRCAKSEY